MPIILHTADLHLKRAGEDRAYSLSVLKEIISVANVRLATHFLICGDMYDSFADFSDNTLREEVRAAFDSLNPDCSVIYITGNHELSGMGGRERLSAYNTGRIKFISDKMEAFTDGGIEFYTVPFRDNYMPLISAYFATKKKFRILMMHGTDSTVYTGPDTEKEEGTGSAQIPDILLSRVQADYAALGHIHEARESVRGNSIAAYCGSPRVWRKGEKGPRKVILFEVNDNRPGPREEIIIKSAGQYREMQIPVNLDGNFSADIKSMLMKAAEESPHDWFELVFRGVAEDSGYFEAGKAELHSALSGRIRRCTLNSLAVKTMSALSDNPAARVFLEAMEARKPAADSPEMEVWLQARMIGLEAINSGLK